MKITTIITIAMLCFSLLACGHDQNKKPKTVYSDANGHYLIEPFTLEGECGDLNAFEIVVWQNEIYDSPANSDLMIEGDLIDGQIIQAFAAADDGTIASFTANLEDNQFITGDWELLDGTCSGYLTGQRLDL